VPAGPGATRTDIQLGIKHYLLRNIIVTIMNLMNVVAVPDSLKMSCSREHR
jgi:hypothetical protein